MNPEIDRKEWDHTEESKYGLGGVRTPEQFYSTFGIDVVHKRTEQHLCRFVESGIMHNKFTPFLRKDGMGIDYDAPEVATYKFVDPLHGEKGSEDNDDEEEEEEEEEEGDEEEEEE